MKVYCMSDIHGYSEAFEEALELVLPYLSEPDVRLVLLGDYIHGPDSYAVLDRILALQKTWGETKVIALKGNHEEMACRGGWAIGEERYAYGPGEQPWDRPYLDWMESLPIYYTVGKVIFVHAGIYEDLKEMWEYTDPHTCIWKFPADTGPFYEDWKIVAGHVGTAELAGDPDFHDIYYDGKAHYYIDGTVQKSGRIPVLLADTLTGHFYRVTLQDCWSVLPYAEYL